MPTQSRKKPPPQTTRDYLVTLEHAIRTLAYGHHTFTIFRHFVELSVIAPSNVADPRKQRARRNTSPSSSNTNRKRCSSFHPCSACSSRAWSRSRPMCSVCCTTGSNHNHQSGQFFTPYPLCQVMAKMLVHDAKRLGEHLGIYTSTRTLCGQRGDGHCAHASPTRGGYQLPTQAACDRHRH